MDFKDKAAGADNEHGSIGVLAGDGRLLRCGQLSHDRGLVFELYVIGHVKHPCKIGGDVEGVAPQG